MRWVPNKPLRLPHLRPYRPGPGDPAIFRFNAVRKEVVAQVADRVSEHHAQSRDSLEYALNECAYHEAERLSRQRDDEARESLGFWRGLMRRVGRMGDDEKRRALRSITGRMADDVAGNFDPRVYRLAENVVPRLITAVMNPAALPRCFLDPQERIRELLVTQGPFQQLERLARKGALVYVPTHSSNMDSIVLGHALQVRGMPPAVYGAGKNLFTNPIISFFMHNLGAYRVDRRVKAGLYKEVLKAYSTVMIERGYDSLFFPGGTRSRSGIIDRNLKLGLLGTAVQAFARNSVNGVSRPVYFVPTTINYALTLEAETLIEDHLKAEGKARYIIEDDEFSRLDRWVAFIRKLTSLTGGCILRFGAPIDPFGNDVDDEGRSLTPQRETIDPTTYVSRLGVASLNAARDMAYTRDLGEVLAARYRSETVIMSTQLVAHVLYRRIVRATAGLDVFVRVRHRGDVSMARDELIREVGEARDALVALVNRGEVHVSPLIRDEPAAHVVDRALSAFRGYHTRAAALDVGAEVTAEDPALLFYYQNRLVDFADRIADEPNIGAAREIARQGGAA